MQRPQVFVLLGHVASLLILTLLAALCGALFASSVWVVAKSAFLGGLVFSLPTIYFTLYAFRYRKAEQATLMAQSFYWGQTSKFSLVTMGFALVFVFGKVLAIPAVFAGFCLMIPAHIVVATFVSENCSRQGRSAE